MIFDEPTNDLDLPTLTVLENFLQNFQGTLVIVSHDRYFMDRIVDHVLAFEGEGKIKDFVGNFSEYRESRKMEDGRWKSENANQKSENTNDAETKLPASSSLLPAKKKLSFKEQRELETIEKEMPELEKNRAEILEKLNNETDYEQIAKDSADLEEVSGKLEEHEMRWLELQELMN